MTSLRTEAVTLDSDGGRRLYEQADELRDAGPAVRVRMPEDVVAWSVTRGDIAKQLLIHPHVSKDARKSWPGHEPGAVPWLYPWVDVVSMFTSDGADHTRLKQLVGRAFTARRIEAMRPVVEAIVTDLLDALEEHAGDERVDLRAEFAHGVPSRVICDLFGVPADQRPEILRIIGAVFATDVTPEQSAAVAADLYRAMLTLIETKRRTPADDMTSLLLTAHEEDGDRLSEPELISTLIAVIGGGSETTVALIDAAVRELLAHPDQLTTVLAEPARWSDVIDEALRLHPPIMHLPLRYATEDIDLGEGVVMKAGDAILICFGAHGRDPGVHDDPAAFHIDRADKQHLAFGHGIHYCLGAPLARLEAEIALPALFDRFPGLTLSIAPDELEPQHSFMGNDLVELPVKLGPSA
ncbi:cytochrome P450 family protein [Streptomyces pseudovenezuelae]|uniref:Cytochrome P450 n=1 Tax=Streptomyces pseudovenezuelae TaxID=67350 RepID=A0ABT6LQE9_9ACTN|nr:cytochrome P450 [Streptomyces pseudovenezuelae]MDH6217886.1 cytochrome P450 [Streptomyces pseudovenezuelae]